MQRDGQGQVEQQQRLDSNRPEPSFDVKQRQEQQSAGRPKEMRRPDQVVPMAVEAYPHPGTEQRDIQTGNRATDGDEATRPLQVGPDGKRPRVQQHGQRSQCNRRHDRRLTRRLGWAIACDNGGHDGCGQRQHEASGQPVGALRRPLTTEHERDQQQGTRGWAERIPARGHGLSGQQREHQPIEDLGSEVQLQPQEFGNSRQRQPHDGEHAKQACRVDGAQLGKPCRHCQHHAHQEALHEDIIEEWPFRNWMHDRGDHVEQPQQEHRMAQHDLNA